MKTKQRNLQAGFSLVELMVVVAIIGILATIAVPNFQRFQAKAKQSSAKVELSGLYTAEKAFSTEYGTYHENLFGIGFVPEGFDTSTGTVSAKAQRYYATAAGGGAMVWPAQLPAATVTKSTYNSTAGQCAAYATAAPTGMAITASTFTAVSAGCPKAANQTTAQADVWTINEQKVLINTVAGI